MEAKEKNIWKKKYVEITILVVLTFFLLFIFKQSKKGMLIIEDQTNSLLTKYTRGLIPLNQKSELNNEDIVNFALYGNLPLDKQNEKILIINSDETGDKKFVITKAKIDYNTNNYENLVSRLDLNSTEKPQIDSLLAKYREKLYSSILINENDAYAINSNVIKLQNELNNKLTYIIDKSVKRKQAEILEAVNEGIKAANEVKLAKNFIFINPDTVFSLVSKKEVEKKIKLQNKNLANHLSFSVGQKKNEKLKMDFQIDDNFISVNIPPPPNDFGEKLAKKINDEVKKELNKEKFIVLQQNNDKDFGFKFNIENLPPDVLNNLQKVDKDILKNLGDLNIKIDSLGMHVKIIAKDSSRNKFKSKSE